MDKQICRGTSRFSTVSLDYDMTSYWDVSKPEYLTNVNETVSTKENDSMSVWLSLFYLI